MSVTKSESAQPSNSSATATRALDIECPKCGERHNVMNMSGANGEPGMYHCLTCGEHFSVG